MKTLVNVESIQELTFDAYKKALKSDKKFLKKAKGVLFIVDHRLEIKAQK